MSSRPTLLLPTLWPDRHLHPAAPPEGNLKFFNLLFPTPLTNEDSLSVLSPTAKPYHDLILANRVSMFDFRIYVFARQGRLLGKLGRKAEGMRKGAEFVRGFGRWLEENAVRRRPVPSSSRRSPPLTT